MFFLRRRVWVLSLCVLGLTVRAWQARHSFEAQTSLFPEPRKGTFQVWVAEEPEVLFDHERGSHDTGRKDGYYQPFVREVRAVCVLLSQKNEQPEIAHQPSGLSVVGQGPTTTSLSPNAPTLREPQGPEQSRRVGAAPRNDSYKKLPPVKVRCTFRLSPGFSKTLLAYGETLVFEGKIQKPPSASNPGQFDYARFLRTKGVAYAAYVSPGKWRKVEKSEIAHQPSGLSVVGQGPTTTSLSPNAPIGAAPRNDKLQHGNFLLRWSYSLKRASQDILYRFLPFPENALMDGILLGERGPLSNEMVETFLVTGTVHILAVSGMGTAFIAGILFLLFRALQMSRKWAAAAGLVGLLFFVLMTGAHPPACRAGLFSGLALLAVLLERKVRGGILLLSTAALLTLMNPMVLEDLSFQISFLATAGLMVLTPRIMERLTLVWEPAALLMATTAAAQVSVWCLIIHCFNQLSPYSILANLVIVPLALFASAGGFVLVLGSFLHPFLGEVFGAACGPPLKLLVMSAEWIAALPGADFVAASPAKEWVVLFHVFLLGAFVLHWPVQEPEAPSEDWRRRQGYYVKGRRVFWAAGVLFLLVSTVGWMVESFRPQPLRVTFLSVGHGNAVVVRSPKGKVLVCDAGKATRGPDRYHPVAAYLRHEGVRKVEAILNTHPDQDHVGGLVNLTRAYPVRQAFAGQGAGSDSKSYRVFKETLQARGVTLLPLKEGGCVEGMGPVPVLVLHPPGAFHPRRAPDNNRSLVSWMDFGGFSFLFPGDIERDGILELLRNHRPFPPVDWLMAPHHGRKSGEPALCAPGFRPRFVVLSDRVDHPEAHEPFRSEVPEAVILSTAGVGAIEVEAKADGTGRYRTYREGIWKSFLSRQLSPSSLKGEGWGEGDVQKCFSAGKVDFSF